MTRLLLALICSAPLVDSEPAAQSAVDIHLITIGPGAHLYTSGGHSAIMIATTEGGVPETEVYNYGDAQFSDTSFVLDFVRGNITFFLSRSGDLTDTVNEYGVRQARDVFMQRLNLTERQKAAIITRLNDTIQPSKRNYRFHHLHALCSSKIRDLLDDVTGGAVAGQLKGNPDPYSVRHYQQWAFSGHWAASLGSALFMGRLHDRPTDKWTAAYIPSRMSEVLREVRVPDPDGTSGTVPLAEAPEVVVRRETPVPKGPNLFPFVVGWLFFGLASALFLLAYRRLPERPRLAGLWLLLWSIPTGLIGLAVLLVLTLSTVPEWRNNELVVVMLATDLALVVPALRWLRGRPEAGRLLRIYAGVRFTGILLVFVLRIVGVLYQEPAIYPGIVLVGAFGLWTLLRRMDIPKPAADRGLEANATTP